MTALEAVREELETALGGDENWRALHPAGGSRGATDPDRRDRDARLVRALEANPLYLAWTNVRQAIDALRDAEAGPEAALGAIELPEDVRARIRADVAGEAIEQPRPPAGEAATAGGNSPEPIAVGVDAKPESDRLSLRMPEPAEAKVTFVRRQTPAAAGKAPADTLPKSPVDGSAFVPVAASTEEAEVAIVNAPVRRFLKALSGD